ncbi:MucB/RseB C-terminal domain-containing protein [Methylotenera sp. N17]|uniref:MucB/RseB C-terminal domain-containing protein n=1 Tax=Methylotenera sp. N17 TaxID=1502761 RepID=UPI000648F23B|nr:MucB/RseB C-terminal domain-containing protein [Methylotenera sp. N17]
MLRWMLACGLCCASLNIQASEDPWLALQKTAFAARELNYQGVFVYQNGNQIRSVQITHMNNAGRELTRNVVLDGQPREVFSEGSDIVIFNAKNNKVVIEKRRGQNLFPAMLPTNLDVIKSSYIAKLGAIERIAGRDAQIIDLVPNDNFRYSYRIWSDAEFGLLLKMTLLDNQNRAIEQIGFTQLSMLNTHELDWFQPKIDLSKQYVMEDETTVNHVSNNWVVANLPPGYRKIDHIEHIVPGKSGIVNQVIFSDGIASVSVFIEPLKKGMRAKTGHKVVGSTNICAHVIDGYQVIVVGEVPAQTVQQIAKAISFNKQPTTTANK